MKNHSFSLLFPLLFSAIFSVFLASLARGDDNHLQVYIVSVKIPDIEISSSAEDLESYYKSFLPIDVLDSGSQTRLVYSYSDVFSGFAARLRKEEVEGMKKLDGFLNAYPDRIYQLQTTHTPKFLGLQPNHGLWKTSNFGKGVIIGVLDSGIWPEHPSFSDDGMPPPPMKWKGICEDMGTDFNASNCNKKLIGARYFNNGSLAIQGKTVPNVSVRDTDGHGTHTASTAAGMFVRNANIFGVANGTAAGIAPLAHLSMYKVCGDVDCAGSDLLAGFDTAVKDGVDIVSISLSGPSSPFYEDAIATGAFAAMEKGVFISCAAGNNGPSDFSTRNEAPWILTVGASTLDRSLSSVIKLGNGDNFTGESLYQPKNFTSGLLPLVYPGDFASYCDAGTLDEIDLKGKIVICQTSLGTESTTTGQNVLQAGAVGMILMKDDAGFVTIDAAHVLPTSSVSYEDGMKIRDYINSTKNPTASIDFRGTVIESNSLAPVIAPFSSRGPNSQSPGILKPDIVGPGVNILAGWPLNLGPDGVDDQRRVSFNVISGTSMSTPHLSGVAALLKSSHPDWSPAAIKSAIMTTADVLNRQGTPIVDHLHSPADLFSMGSGLVNPSKANDPGLVYDLQPDDYILYLCGLGYSDEQIETITKGRSVKCSNKTSISQGDLNYPSFSVIFQAKGESSQTFTRTVTNVGDASSSYTVKIEVPKGTNVTVIPSKLSFSGMNEMMSYILTVTLKGSSSSSTSSQGFVNWVSSDKKHSVRSPISVTYQ